MHPTPLPAADQRSAEILSRVRVAFAEKGFDGTSMQDLARAAGMSAGNFYRYFPSKAALVEALIAHDLAEMAADFEQVLAAPRPMQALRELTARRIIEPERCEDGQLWAEITAAALRKPEICEAACRMEGQVISFLNRVFAVETGLSEAEVARRFPAEAAFVVTLFKSAAMIPPQSGELRPHLTAMILRTIHQTLSHVSQSAAADVKA